MIQICSAQNNAYEVCLRVFFGGGGVEKLKNMNGIQPKNF